MVDGLAPNVAYLPVAALAALTAALVTLVLAVSAWKKATTTESLESEQSSSSSPSRRRSSDEEQRTDSTSLSSLIEHYALSSACRKDSINDDETSSIGAGAESDPSSVADSFCPEGRHGSSGHQQSSSSDCVISNGIRHRNSGTSPNEFSEIIKDCNLESHKTGVRATVDHNDVGDSTSGGFTSEFDIHATERSKCLPERYDTDSSKPDDDQSLQETSGVSQEQLVIADSTNIRTDRNLCDVFNQQLTDNQSSSDNGIVVCETKTAPAPNTQNRTDNDLLTLLPSEQTNLDRNSISTNPSALVKNVCDKKESPASLPMTDVQFKQSQPNEYSNGVCLESEALCAESQIQVDLSRSNGGSGYEVISFERHASDEMNPDSLTGNENSSEYTAEDMGRDSESSATDKYTRSKEMKTESANHSEKAIGSAKQKVLVVQREAGVNSLTSHICITETSFNAHGGSSEKTVSDFASSQNSRLENGYPNKEKCVLLKIKSSASNADNVAMNGCESNEQVTGAIPTSAANEPGKTEISCSEKESDETDDGLLDEFSIKRASEMVFFRYANVEYPERNPIEVEDFPMKSKNISVIDTGEDIKEIKSFELEKFECGIPELDSDSKIDQENVRFPSLNSDESNNATAPTVIGNGNVDLKIEGDSELCFNISEQIGNGFGITRSLRNQDSDTVTRLNMSSVPEACVQRGDNPSNNSGRQSVSERESMNGVTQSGTETVCQTKRENFLLCTDFNQSAHNDDDTGGRQTIASEILGDKGDDCIKTPQQKVSMTTKSGSDICGGESESGDTLSFHPSTSNRLQCIGNKSTKNTATASFEREREHSSRLLNNDGASVVDRNSEDCSDIIDATENNNNRRNHYLTATPSTDATTTSQKTKRSSPSEITARGKGSERDGVMMNAAACDDFDSECDYSQFETHEEACQLTTKPNNGQQKDGVGGSGSCCLLTASYPPCDVTADSAGKSSSSELLEHLETEAASTAEQDGKSQTKVQGSFRDHLIGKVNLENQNNKNTRAAESHEGCSFSSSSMEGGGKGENDEITVSPALSARTEELFWPQLQMMSNFGDEMSTSRCSAHDPACRSTVRIPLPPTATTVQQVSSSEGLERLDALVDLLKDLANDVDSGVGAASSGDSRSLIITDSPYRGDVIDCSGVKDVAECDNYPSCDGIDNQQREFQLRGFDQENNEVFLFYPVKSEDLSSPIIDNYSVEFDEGLNTTHSSYNADVSNNYLASDESTTGGYPADTSSLFVPSSSERHDLTADNTLLDSEVVDAFTTSTTTVTTRSSYCLDLSERTELLSIDESLSSALSPTENDCSLIELIGNAKCDQQSNSTQADIGRHRSTSSDGQDSGATAQPLTETTQADRTLVLQNLRALTLRLQIPSGGVSTSETGTNSNSSSYKLFSDDHLGVSVDDDASLNVVKNTNFGEDTASDSFSEMFEADSPRRQRLLKLLERDQERQLRLKELSESWRGSGQDQPVKRSSSVDKNDEESSEKTLHDLESAIDHMQEMIGRKESFDPHFCTSSSRDANENELYFATIEDRRKTDAGRQINENYVHDITFAITDEHRINHINTDGTEESSVQTRCSETYHLKTDSLDGEVTLKNVQEVRTDCEGYYCSTEISVGKTEVSENTEVLIYDSVSSPEKRVETRSGVKDNLREKVGINHDLSSRFTDDRWRDVSGKDDTEGSSSSRDEEMLIRSSAQNRLLRRREEKIEKSSKSRTIPEHHFGSAELNERIKNCDFGVGAEWRSRSDGAGDVSQSLAQSQRFTRGEERGSAAAARGSLSFRGGGDENIAPSLQRPAVPMESGGGVTAMEDISPPLSTEAATTGNSTSTTPAKTPTPTKIKNLRFKLDPDIFDLPSENGYEDDEYNRRPNWRKQTKYNTFSALDLGRNKEPVKVVSVRTSVVPGGQKMVVKPVCVSEGQRTTTTTNGRVDDSRITVKHLDIDLRIRLETEDHDKNQEFVVYDSKKDKVVKSSSSPEAHATKCYITANVPPAQTKRRSPVPDYSSWNQSLSPVSETCDFMPSSADSRNGGTGSQSSFDSGERNVHWSPESSFRSTDISRDESLSSLDEGGNNHGVFTNGHSETPTTDVTNTSLEDEPVPFKSCQYQHNGVKENGDGPLLTSTPSRPSTLSLSGGSKYRKHVQLPRKKFVPDPEAIERITGYKAAETKSQTKPPLPPVIRSLSSNRIGSNSKTRIEQLRKRYLDSKSLMAAQRADGSLKFEEFRNRAQEDRAKIITSTPDLAAFEAAVRSQWSKARKQAENGKENSPPASSHQTVTQAEVSDIDPGRCGTPDDVWLSYVQSVRRQLSKNRRSQSLSYLETDIDAFLADDSRFAANLEPANSTQSLAMPPSFVKEHRIGLPIDESGRTKSEHELRIERSLQNLTVPDWYKHSQRPKTGFILEKKSDEKKGWAAVKSLNSSTSSLSSAGTKPKRPTVRSLRSSRENLQWSRGSSSPASADNSYGGNRWGRTHSGPVLSLAVAKAFREPYLGWRTRTPSSCASPSPQPDFSPPSWVVIDNNTDRSDTPLTSDLQAMDEEEDDDEENGFSFEGEDVLETANTSSMLLQGGKLKKNDESSPHSADDTCEDVVNISMETCDAPQMMVMMNGRDSRTQDLHNEDTCDDIKNITMDTFELVPPSPFDEPKLLLSPVGDDTSDDILNISTDTSSQQNHHHHYGGSEVHLNGGVEESAPIGAATENTCDEIDNIPTDNSDACMMTCPMVMNGGDGSRSGSVSPMQQDCTTTTASTPSDSQASEPISNKLKESSTRERSRFDPKRKRYSYNRSIYQNELDGVLKGGVTKGQLDDDELVRQSREGLHQDGGSTRSLPAGNECAKNNVIWIESSFVGSRTTTSIVVMPPERNNKHKKTNGCCRGGSTGSSSSSVGRPASR